MATVSDKRRVLLVLEATLGGTGRHILDLTKGLLDRNCEVHLVYSNLRADVQFTRGIAKLQRERPEFRTHQIQIARAVAPSDLRVFWRLFQYLKQHGPFDIIHGHSTKAGFIARLVPGTGNSAKIYTPHALMTMDPRLKGIKRRAVSTLESFLARRSTKVVVLSREEWQCARITGIPEDKLVLIENGVDIDALTRFSTQRVEVRKALGVPRDAGCVGFVGRLSDQKEPMRLLEAFALAKKRASRPTKLVIVGFGPLESALKARVIELGIDSDVIWAGPVDGAVYMSAFDVLALCSRIEGFSYVLLEAMAAGVPFVSTPVGVATEIVKRSGGGFVCSPWNSDTFADLLVRVLEEPGLRDSLSDAARRAVEEFSVDRMVDRISALYSSVAAVRAPIPRERASYQRSGGSR